MSHNQAIGVVQRRAKIARRRPRLEPNRVYPFTEHRERETFAITGGNCPFLMPQDRPSDVFRALSGAQAILSTMPERMDHLAPIRDPNVIQEFPQTLRRHIWRV